MSFAFNRSKGIDKELSLPIVSIFPGFLFYFATSSSPYYDNCLVLKNDGAEKLSLWLMIMKIGISPKKSF